jgi:MFS transporter, MHS family, alpha-ketoglutarate permease
MKDNVDGVDVRRIRAIFIGSVGNLFDGTTSTLMRRSRFISRVHFRGLVRGGFSCAATGWKDVQQLADNYVRRDALTLSVALMCFGSLMVAATPTCQSIGLAAPIVLAIAYIVLGLSQRISPRWRDERNRGFFSSFEYVTLIDGRLCALLVLLLLEKFLLTPEQMRAWAGEFPS